MLCQKTRVQLWRQTDLQLSFKLQQLLKFDWSNQTTVCNLISNKFAITITLLKALAYVKELFEAISPIVVP